MRGLLDRATQLIHRRQDHGRDGQALLALHREAIMNRRSSELIEISANLWRRTKRIKAGSMAKESIRAIAFVLRCSGVYCGPVLRHPAELMLPAVDLGGRVWLGSKSCKGGPAAPAFGG